MGIRVSFSMALASLHLEGAARRLLKVVALFGAFAGLSLGLFPSTHKWFLWAPLAVFWTVVGAAYVCRYGRAIRVLYGTWNVRWAKIGENILVRAIGVSLLAVFVASFGCVKANGGGQVDHMLWDLIGLGLSSGMIAVLWVMTGLSPRKE